MISNALLALDDDTLILLYSFLDLKTILSLRQVSRRLLAVSKTRIVWLNALKANVIHQGYPVPFDAIQQFNSFELEVCTRNSHEAGLFWTDPSRRPRRRTHLEVSSCAISEVHFLLDHKRNRFVTVTTGIWVVVEVWDMGDLYSPLNAAPKKIAEWCPKGIVLRHFVVNSVPNSEFVIALSYDSSLPGHQHIEVFSLREQESRFPYGLVCRRKMEMKCAPVALQAHHLIISDDAVETHIVDLKTKCSATLQGLEVPADYHFQYNRCLNVIFKRNYVFVVRARSMEVFTDIVFQPPGAPLVLNHPVASHSFGWIGGIALSPQSLDNQIETDHFPPYTIVLRAENDDPWSQNTYSLNVYTLHPNPDYVRTASPSSSRSSSPDVDISTHGTDIDKSHLNQSSNDANLNPYIFPPTLEKTIPLTRGYLRLPKVFIGRNGTGIWVQARPRHTDLTTFDVHSSEAQAPHSDNPREYIAGALFPGVLHDRHPELSMYEERTLCKLNLVGGNFTAADYDEKTGRLVLGTWKGNVIIFDL
ncbi:hypothetical protein C8Q75DRAFT_759520 [Abortiporus biennis]|nr:hypothetical protein C8Q75DRAFT_759520 [Abortiporus biennis]